MTDSFELYQVRPNEAPLALDRMFAPASPVHPSFSAEEAKTAIASFFTTHHRPSVAAVASLQHRPLCKSTRSVESGNNCQFVRL